VLVAHLPVQSGLIGPAAIALLVVAGAFRLARAVWHNERYWFTTWRWGWALVLAAMTGLLLKVLMA
jgi:hypothetical protein